MVLKYWENRGVLAGMHNKICKMKYCLILWYLLVVK